MKREAIGHSKMKRLCRRLDIPTWQGVGLLESIWHLTARETPRGDIGKLSDEDIALAIDYRGDESKLVEALVLSGWLDADAEERLVVHDWHEHADDALHMRLARTRQFFVGGHAPKISRLTGKDREAAHEYYESCALEYAHGSTDSCAQTNGVSAPPEPRQSPAPPEPEPEPAATAARAACESFSPPTNGSNQEDIEEIRELLANWNRHCGLNFGRPDDVICKKVLAAGGGNVLAIRLRLQELWNAGKKPSTSYGWFGSVLKEK